MQVAEAAGEGILGGELHRADVDPRAAEAGRLGGHVGDVLGEIDKFGDLPDPSPDRLGDIDQRRRPVELRDHRHRGGEHVEHGADRIEQLVGLGKHRAEDLVDRLTDVDRDIVKGHLWRAAKLGCVAGDRAGMREGPVDRQQRRHRGEGRSHADVHVEGELGAAIELGSEQALDVGDVGRHLVERKPAVGIRSAARILDIDAEDAGDTGTDRVCGGGVVGQIDGERAERAGERSLRHCHVERKLHLARLTGGEPLVGLQVDSLGLADADAEHQIEAHLHIH